MSSLLLVVIFLSFISLGLPDSVLGVLWPQMRIDLGQSIEILSSVELVVVAGTIISSFLTGWLVRKIGTGKLTLLCCVMTGTSLLGLSFIHHIIFFYALAIPLGLGAGSVDAALNNYVAEHYRPRFMNWLHGFWGFGAILAPLLVTKLLINGYTWRTGFKCVAVIQLTIASILLVMLPIWKIVEAENNQTTKPSIEKVHISKPWRTKGAFSSMLLFFFYCGAEYSMIIWVVSYLREYRELTIAMSGLAQSLLFFGITGGRFISGMAVGKIGNRSLVKIGMLVALSGAAVLIFSNNGFISLCASAITGFGFAPIYPCMMHESVMRFKNGTHTAIVGYQVGMAGFGVAVVPVAIGYLAKPFTLILMPVSVLCLMLLSLFVFSRLNKIT